MNDRSQETGYEVSRRNKNDFWFACVDIAVIRDPTLSTTDKAVYMSICSHVDIRTRSCPLRVGTIAGEVGCSERTAQRSLDVLESRGIIQRSRNFKNGLQKASEILVVGHHAPCYQERGAEGTGDTHVTGDTDDTPTGDTHVTPSLREPKTHEKKDTLTGGVAAPQPEAIESEPPKPQPPQDTERFPVTEAPQVMRPTAEYLLFKTGRKALKESELSALRTLNARHQPARVQMEIDKAVERFRRKQRPLASLEFGYIADSLRYQTSRPQSRGPCAAPANKREPMPKFSEPEAREFTDEEAAALEAKYAGEGMK